MGLRRPFDILLSSALVLLLGLSTASSECPYGALPPVAVVGNPSTLSCNADCPTSVYEWERRDDGQWSNIPGSTTDSFTVSQNVTSISSVGGLEYRCLCSNSDQCQNFKIGVQPVVTLMTSQPAVRMGRSADVTCLGESYPAANNLSNYNLEHPIHFNIKIVLLDNKSGVVHYINEADKDDDGEYVCIVTVKLAEYDNPLQSDSAIISLIVYDPPRISSSSNYTIAEAGQKALLECTVDNIEGDRLGVWVEWYYTKTMNPLTEEHENFTLEDVYYLLIYNASERDYTCLLFSAYSPDTPEDEKTVSIIKIGTSGDTRDEGKDSDVTVAILIVIIMVLLVLSLIFLSILMIIYRKKIKQFSARKCINEKHEFSREAQSKKSIYSTNKSDGPHITSDCADSSAERIAADQIEPDNKTTSVTLAETMPDISETKDDSKTASDEEKHPPLSKPQKSVDFIEPSKMDKSEKGSIVKEESGSIQQNRSSSSLQGSQHRGSIPKLVAFAKQLSQPKLEKDNESVGLLSQEIDDAHPHFELSEKTTHDTS